MFLEFTNKPEKTYIVHLLSIFIRISELEKSVLFGILHFFFEK